MIHRVLLHPVPTTIALFCVLGISGVQAQDASPWEKEPHAAARLIAGTAHKSADGTWLRAGIQIRLDPGWHTYWRYPGDSGVPPTFNFSASANVKSVTVLWPAPKGIADGAGGRVIGYVGGVIFPLRITARQANKPSFLHVKLGYAFCKNVCYPAETDLDLTLPAKSSAEEPLLDAAETRVPRRVTLGARDGLTIRSVHRTESEGHERVLVEVVSPNGAPVDLFAEGPTLPVPNPVNSAPAGSPEVQQFTFDLDGLPSGARADGAVLTLTAASHDAAIESRAPLN